MKAIFCCGQLMCISETHGSIIYAPIHLLSTLSVPLSDGLRGWPKAEFWLGGIHRLRWQDFPHYWPPTLYYLLECILRKNVFDKRWVSIFSTLTKFEQHLCLQIDEMSNFTCYLQSLVPGKVYIQNMYITIHKWSNYNTILYKN